MEGYFRNNQGLTNCKYACLGSATEEELIERGHRANFVGKGQPKDVAVEFKNTIKNETVLFPIGSMSLRTVQQLFPPDQIKEVKVYNTSLNTGLIPSSDFYLFTSPSNVESFFSHTKNTIPPHAKTVAIGSSTLKALSKNGVKAKKSKTPLLESMLELILA